MDIVVEDAVVIELKCVDRVMPVHEAQLISYLRLAKIKFGVILNFHVPVMTREIVRSDSFPLCLLPSW